MDTKLKIAFDVKGTLEGYKEKTIRELAEALWRQGHEITVWSSMSSIAYAFVKKYDFPYGVTGKFMKIDCDSEDEMFDFAIEDDHTQDYLAAKKLIFVDEIKDVESTLKLINGETT